MKHIKRTAADYNVETSIAKDSLDTPHFSMEDYFKYPSGDKKDYRVFHVSKRGYTAGLSFEILKSGKRTQSLSVEMGLQELDMFIQYLQDMRPRVKDYAGTHEVLEP